jgi:class 3 adenylate cyclase
VNLASRLVDHADPGSVLADGAVRDRLAGNGAATTRSVGTRRLKGIGEVEVWRVEAEG